MRIAIPVRRGALCEDVAGCEAFVFLDVDPDTRRVIAEHLMVAPPRQHGELPSWLAQMGATTLIASTLSAGTRDLCQYHGLTVLIGAPGLPPSDLVGAYLNGGLTRSAQ